MILKELLPIAREGLLKAAVDKVDIDRLLGVIEARVKTGKTGSQWMLDAYQKLGNEVSKDEALIALTAGISRSRKAPPCIPGTCRKKRKPEVGKIATGPSSKS